MSATFSACGRYRYRLGRDFDKKVSTRGVAFLMLNLEIETSALRVARNAEQPGRYKHVDAQFFQVAHARGLPVGIRAVVAWARTERGGKQLPLLAPAPTGGCMRWGICDTPSGSGDGEP